jgi:RNA polymerase sigma-70 factor (ECF subfamily)
LAAAGAERLLARATDQRALDAAALTPRIAGAVQKYLLRDDPSASAESIAEFCDGLHADDLCLIVACELGHQSAWDDLVRQFSATVKSAARSTAGNEDAAEDLAQSIWAELYGLRRREDGTVASKLAYYSGRGSLGGWLRAVVGQLAVDQHRKQSRLVQPEEDADLDRLAHDGHSTDAGAFVLPTERTPESDLAQTRAAGDVESALQKAIAGLEAEDRLLVKLYYFDDLRLREIGAVLGFHEATASRRLSRVQSDIRKRVEQILISERGWTRDETARSLASAAIDLDTDVERMLATGKAGPEAQPDRGG